jgi:hypothetical protein
MQSYRIVETHLKSLELVLPQYLGSFNTNYIICREVENRFFKDEYFVKQNKSILLKNSSFDMESSKISIQQT